ncbi:hypothetical protein M758_8G174400 [Ceratodon purpureus]|nr:hypothetical protein M758_8G174400 [Ceratodon purpureus]
MLCFWAFCITTASGNPNWHLRVSCSLHMIRWLSCLERFFVYKVMSVTIQRHVEDTIDLFAHLALHALGMIAFLQGAVILSSNFICRS